MTGIQSPVLLECFTKDLSQCILLKNPIAILQSDANFWVSLKKKKDIPPMLSVQLIKYAIILFFF